MKNLLACVAGALFSCGLMLSGMVDPQKVLGFLTLTANWDPSLAFVMGGALAASIPATHFILKRSAPVLASDFDVPNKQTIDSRLIGGAAIFGVGWGLFGVCPGPAVVQLTSLQPAILLFFSMMLVGAMMTQKFAMNRL